MDATPLVTLTLAPSWLELAVNAASAASIADLERRCELAVAAIIPRATSRIIWAGEQAAVEAPHTNGTTALFPLRAGEQRCGWLEVSPGPITADQSQALATLTAILGPAACLIDGQRRERRERRRQAIAAELAALDDPLDLDSILQLAYRLARQALSFNSFVIALRRNGSGWLEGCFVADASGPIPSRTFWRDTAGLTGLVLRSGEPLLTDSYAAECKRRGILPVVIDGINQAYAWIGVPIGAAPATLGVVIVANSDPELRYTSDQLDLMIDLSQAIAGPLQTAGLRRLAEEQTRRLESLNRIGRTINSSLDPAQTPQLIMELVQELLNVEEGSLLLRDEATDDLVFSYASGPAGNRLLGQRLRPGVGIAGYVVTSERSTIANDTNNDGRFYTGADSRSGFTTRSLLAVPLRGLDGVRGVIEVMNRRDNAPFTDADRQLLEAVADQAVIALENARRFAQIDQALARRARDLDRINDELRKILRLGNALRAEQPLDDLLIQVARAITESTGVSSVAIAMVRRERTSTPYLQRLAMAGPAATHFPRLRAARARLDQFEAMLSADRQISPAIYRIRRSHPDYTALWGGPEFIYQPDQPAGATEGWYPDDLVICLMRARRGDLLGALLVDDPNAEGPPSAERLQVLEIFASQAAAAIENAQLYSLQQQSLTSMMALNALGMAINSTLRSDRQIIDLTVAGMVEMTEASGAVVFLRPEPGSGAPEALPVVFRTGSVPLPDGEVDRLAHEAVASGRPASLLVPAHRQGDDPSSCLVIPLRATRQVLGAICIGYAAGLPDPADRESLTLFAGQAAVAIESIRLVKAISEGRDQLASIMASTQEGMLLIGPDGRVAVANAALLALSDLGGEPRPEALAGTPVTTLLARWRAAAVYPDADWLPLEEALAAIPRDDVEIARGQLGARSAGPRALEWTALRVSRASETAGRSSLLVVRDITAAREAERLRQDLTSMIVHDLRSPLSSILTSIEMIFRGIGGEISPSQREILGIAHASARHLLEMVNLLLDISRLEGGKMPLNREPLSVEQVSRRATNRLMALAQSKRIAIDLNIAPDTRLIYADGELIMRVMQNLLDNAIKFSASEGRVLVTVENAPPELDGEGREGPAVVRFAVRDFGPGISPRDREKIFAKFSQAGSRRGNGTGLGLTFCKLVVETHGGRIWVESVVGEGSTFLFTLPSTDIVELQHDL